MTSRDLPMPGMVPAALIVGGIPIQPDKSEANG